MGGDSFRCAIDLQDLVDLGVGLLENGLVEGICVVEFVDWRFCYHHKGGYLFCSCILVACCFCFCSFLCVIMVEGDKPPKEKGIEGGSSELKLDIYDPLYLHHQDVGSQLITFKLEGTENYKVWSAAVQLTLHARNKTGFINRKCVRDVENGPLQVQWDMCNVVVLSWLSGCVSQDLYKGRCNALWRQFDALIDLPGCTCKVAPKIKDHNQLLRYESYKNSNIASKSTKSGPAAFAARPRGLAGGSNLVCKHYNMTGHIIDRCFELVGYPQGFKKSNGGQNNSNNATSNDNKIDHNKSAPHTLTND
ncbi:putative RNA-directed DNA polymerase [Tanacetum coccineum]